MLLSTCGSSLKPSKHVAKVYLGIGLGYALLFVLYVIPFLRTCLCDLLVGRRRLVKAVLDIVHKNLQKPVAPAFGGFQISALSKQRQLKFDAQNVQSLRHVWLVNPVKSIGTSC